MVTLAAPTAHQAHRPWASWLAKKRGCSSRREATNGAPWYGYLVRSLTRRLARGFGTAVRSGWSAFQLSGECAEGVKAGQAMEGIIAECNMIRLLNNAEQASKRHSNLTSRDATSMSGGQVGGIASAGLISRRCWCVFVDLLIGSISDGPKKWEFWGVPIRESAFYAYFRNRG